MLDSGPRNPTSSASLADLSPAPIFLVQDRVVQYANRAFAELCGADVAALVGQPFPDLVHPHDRSHVLERLDEHRRGRPDTYRAQFRLSVPNREPVWVYATLSPVSHGGREATIGSALDARERRHAQEAVTKAQRLDAVARLAGGVAHAFNNTLQVILGHAERIGATLPEGHPSVGSVGEIRRGAERAAALTDRLLSFGQRQVLDPQSVDVARLVADLKDPIERRLGPSIALVIRRGRFVAAARVDRTRFVHVIAALVDHARAAMPQGGQLAIGTDVVSVDAAARAERPWLRDGGFVKLTVEDSGPALKAETAAHAFEPFYTTRSGEDGLDLATVYGLVKQSQGFVWVEDGANGGTRAVVLLPVEGPVSAAVTDAPASPPLRAVPAPQARTRVLVVEDEASVRELLAGSLDRHGFSATAVGSAEEALRVPLGSYDMLLSDISLPGMNGVALAKHVRQALPAVKVLLMSGYAREEFLTPADDLPFIGKPFTTRAIVDRIRSLTAESALEPLHSRPA
ncbi:MAG TPA: PAS domain S-box protein [Vicinamibacterales bacterium]